MYYIFVINGREDRAWILEEIKHQIQASNVRFDYETYVTRGVGDGTRFVKIYCDLHPQSEVCFVACGGSGTLNEVVSGMAGSAGKYLAFFACGATNDFIKCFPDRDFRSILKLIAGDPLKVDLIRVNDSYAINTVNIGFDAVVASTANLFIEKGYPVRRSYNLGILLALLRSRRNRIKVLAELTKLRQICCDPHLIYENYKGHSAKLDTCMELIRQAIEGGHKMLVFSQFTSMLELIEARLKKEKVGWLKLTGATSKEERVRLVDKFQTGKTPVFLISLKAGGTGLNLTAADVVIHYDPWWNVAAENQATDRTHRIGQTREVSVFKIIAKDTIEEKIQKMQEAKRDLAESVLGGEATSSSAISREDLLALLDAGLSDQ